MIKRAIILADVSEDFTVSQSNGDFVSNIRSLGPLEVRAKFKKYGWSVELLEFAMAWQSLPNNMFLDLLDLYYESADEAILAISASVIRELPITLEPTLKHIKEKHPKVKIILGGIRSIKHETEEYFSKYIDAVFIGRSMEMLEDYLSGNDMSRYAKIKDRNFYLNTLPNYNIERPVVCELLEDNDFLTKHDVLGIEIGLGCKFNCTFCNYPMRNSKTVYLAPEEAVAKSMQEAYDRFGITNFYVADDTINETDAKLQILVDAVKQLSFTPNIGGFARLDVLANRPHQIELFKQVNFRSPFFGVETFNHKASKLIRKKHLENTVEETLVALKNEMPHVWPTVGVIMGLEHDSTKELIETTKRLVDKGLVCSIVTSPLNIKHKEDFLITDEGHLSEMDKDPEKFGYVLNEETYWKNSTTNMNEIWDEYKNDVLPYLEENMLIQFNGFIFLNLQSLECVEPNETSESIRHRLLTEDLFKEYRFKINRARYKYINKKIKQIKEDYGT